MRGFCLADRFCARLDGGCPLVPVGQCDCRSYGSCTLHVKHLNVPSWARFLQILEDAGPVWTVAVLYGPAAQNIAMRKALNLLTDTDPGGAVSVSGGLDTLACETVKCWKCGMCYGWPLCPGLTQGDQCGHASKCAP